jgi:hypothetical protein
MSTVNTRKKLIKLIAEHQFGGSGKKLKIEDLADRGGISRQAFNRNYGDLKPYVKGERPITELMEEAENDSSHRFLAQSQSQLQELRTQLAQIEHKHQKEMDLALKSHVTTLMNNDLTLLDSSEVRSTLEKQSLHTQSLIEQIDGLELQLTKEKAKALRQPAQTQNDIPQNKMIIRYNLDTIFSKVKNGDPDAADQVEDAKEVATSAICKKLNSLTKEKNPRLVIFAERYCSQFEFFAANFRCENGHYHAIVQLPVFSSSSLNMFLRTLEVDYVVSVYVPYCSAVAVLKAQQNFYFRDIPAYELTCAEKATPLSMSEKIEKLVYFKVKQGD